MTTSSTSTRPQAGVAPRQSEEHALVRRARVMAAMTVSGLIFWYVGWWVVGPTDPSGPISLLAVDHGVVAMAEMLGLAVITGGLAVAICGSGSAAQGPIAVAFGLAVLGLRGEQLDVLMMERLGGAAAGAGGLSFPATELIAETWLWLAVIAVGSVVGRWVEGWHERPTELGGAPSPHVDSPGEIRQGLGVTAVIALAAYNLFRFFGGGVNDDILKGQIYFSIGAAFVLSTMLAHWLFRGASRIWGLIAVALVAIAAYWLNGPDATELQAAAAAARAYVALDPAARPLPIEFAALGALGAQFGYMLGRPTTAALTTSDD